MSEADDLYIYYIVILHPGRGGVRVYGQDGELMLFSSIASAREYIRTDLVSDGRGGIRSSDYEYQVYQMDPQLVATFSSSAGSFNQY